MKNLIAAVGIFLVQLINAQEAGKIGELLKNEAPKKSTNSTEIGPPLATDQNTPKTPTDKQNRHRSIFPQEPNSTHKQYYYQWNYPYQNQYAEVFLRIPERGMYTVVVNDQSITNSNGYYRFFDLIPYNSVINIYWQNYLVYSSRLPIRPNTRLVLDYFSQKGLYMLGSYSINYYDMQNYQWGTIWNYPYENNQNYSGNNNENYGNNNSNYPYYGQNNGNYYKNNYVMSTQEFSSFCQALTRKSFDDEKKNLILQQLNHSSFTAEQLRKMLTVLNWDDNRLEIAKKAYHYCYDRQNYYMLEDAFTYNSSKIEFNRFLSFQR